MGAETKNPSEEGREEGVLERKIIIGKKEWRKMLQKPFQFYLTNLSLAFRLPEIRRDVEPNFLPVGYQAKKND